MAIQRLKSAEYIPSPMQLGAYAESQGSWSVGTFTSVGQTGTVLGQTYRYHVLSAASTGSFVFSRGGYIDILLLGGGGQGGVSWFNSDAVSSYGGGGGGAGGLLIIYNVRVNAEGYTYIVGSGGNGTNNYWSADATNTQFLSYVALAGGRGGMSNVNSKFGTNASQYGANGASGGGGTYNYSWGYAAGGNGMLGQGNPGGSIEAGSSAGGGGYSSAGFTTTSNTTGGGKGGNGISVNFDGTIRPLAAGGGGGNYNTTANNGTGGLVDGVVTGGSGTNNSGAWVQAASSTQTPTAFGCGGGGGGSYGNNTGQYGGNGSSGLLIIRYPV